MSLVDDCDALLKIMAKCSDAWWGGIGEADDTDWRAAMEIAYRIRARATVPEAASTRSEAAIIVKDVTVPCLHCGMVTTVKVTHDPSVMNEWPHDAEQAALWRDLVLLHPMDLMVIFGGAENDVILLGKLKEWIEQKRRRPQKDQS